MRAATSAKSPFSLSLSLSHPLFSQFFCCVSFLFAFNTCSCSGAVSQQTLPRLHLGKDFTVKGHRLRLSNKQSGTGEPTTHTFTPVFSLCLLISWPTPPQLHSTSFPAREPQQLWSHVNFAWLAPPYFTPPPVLIPPFLAPHTSHITLHIKAQFMQ